MLHLLTAGFGTLQSKACSMVCPQLLAKADIRAIRGLSGFDPGCVKTLRGITAPGILSSVVVRRAKKCKNLSFARHYDQIRFRFRTAKTHNPNLPPLGSCQLSPAADMTLHRPSPLCAITGREQVQHGTHKAHVAIGSCVLSRAPAQIPYVRLSRIRLPRRVSTAI